MVLFCVAALEAAIFRYPKSEIEKKSLDRTDHSHTITLHCNAISVSRLNFRPHYPDLPHIVFIITSKRQLPSGRTGMQPSRRPIVPLQPQDNFNFMSGNLGFRQKSGLNIARC